MSETRDTLSYSAPHRPSQPISIRLCLISLAMAALPILAMPFAPSGRAFNGATGIVIGGLVCSPLNFCWSLYQALRGRRRGRSFGILLFAAFVAGVESTLLCVILLYVAINGMPC